MKKRIISAVVLIPLLLIVLLVCPNFITSIMVAGLAGEAAFELLSNTGLVKNQMLVSSTLLMAFGMGALVPYEYMRRTLMLVFFVFVATVFMEKLLHPDSATIESIGICMIGGLLIPYSLSRISFFQNAYGKLATLLPFVICFMSDSGAYFTGKWFGKHHFAPYNSPNKTIEGVVGGVVWAVLGVMVFFSIVNSYTLESVKLLLSIPYGIIGSLVATFGDLCFSSIKRQTKIKDFGNIIPGHGGILDRFDSMVMVCLFLQVMLEIVPFTAR